MIGKTNSLSVTVTSPYGNEPYTFYLRDSGGTAKISKTLYESNLPTAFYYTLTSSDKTGVWKATLSYKDIDEIRGRLVTVTITATAVVMTTAGDYDGDGLDNLYEYNNGLNPASVDTDGDGLSDGAEVNTYRTSASLADTDGDGLWDGFEVNTQKTNPLAYDTDSDGLGDGAEVYTYKTNPLVKDTDGDGLSDGLEVNTYGTNPLVQDTDADGLSDALEVNTYHTNPLAKDTDYDGAADAAEIYYGTNPTIVDTDFDGLWDGAELYTYYTDPKNPDTDRDGLKDGAEVNTYKTSPTNPDSDFDKIWDGYEVNRGMNPKLASDGTAYIQKLQGKYDQLPTKLRVIGEWLLDDALYYDVVNYNWQVLGSSLDVDATYEYMYGLAGELLPTGLFTEAMLSNLKLYEGISLYAKDLTFVHNWKLVDGSYLLFSSPAGYPNRATQYYTYTFGYLAQIREAKKYTTMLSRTPAYDISSPYGVWDSVTKRYVMYYGANTLADYYYQANQVLKALLGQGSASDQNGDGRLDFQDFLWIQKNRINPIFDANLNSGQKSYVPSSYYFRYWYRGPDGNLWCGEFRAYETGYRLEHMIMEWIRAIEYSFDPYVISDSQLIQDRVKKIGDDSFNPNRAILSDLTTAVVGLDLAGIGYGAYMTIMVLRDLSTELLRYSPTAAYGL